ncbi:TetR family transcriptional regulator [Nocardia asteroides]|uniref:TetR family transcriptional regulator n=1 Tax=Nocardia asteroides TaxID=1824 RepID=UPI001E31FE7C|nr:TetR family transcriptional regulator [Nocardia asteroides]UGT64170.1 TetR family transcriptional regulator [Nocardia asteroides]
MSVRGEMVKTRLRPTISEAVEQAAASLDHGGMRGLRVLLHAGMSAYWPLVKGAPVKQVRAYEGTLQSLRLRWETGAGCLPSAGTAGIFAEMDRQAVAFLELCAERSGMKWLEPVEAVAAYAVSVLHGTVLRWLSDCDDETMLVVLDDLVSSLAARAVEN